MGGYYIYERPERITLVATVFSFTTRGARSVREVAIPFFAAGSIWSCRGVVPFIRAASRSVPGAFIIVTSGLGNESDYGLDRNWIGEHYLLLARRDTEGEFEAWGGASHTLG